MGSMRRRAVSKPSVLAWAGRPLIGHLLIGCAGGGHGEAPWLITSTRSSPTGATPASAKLRRPRGPRYRSGPLSRKASQPAVFGKRRHSTRARGTKQSSVMLHRARVVTGLSFHVIFVHNLVCLHASCCSGVLRQPCGKTLTKCTAQRQTQPVVTGCIEACSWRLAPCFIPLWPRPGAAVMLGGGCDAHLSPIA